MSKTISERIKAALLELGINIPATPVAAPVVKLEDVQLIDGTMLNVDSLEVGAKATFTGADGVPVPAEGSYETADGSTIVCAAGLITEIKPKEADVQPEMDMKTVLSKLAELSDRVKAFDGKFKSQDNSEQIKTLEAKLEKTEKALVSTLELVDELSKTAAALPLELQANAKPVKDKFEKELSDEEYNKLSNKDKLAYNKIWK